ncbi:MAG: AgmX/PglI C-terminal domain-containing protein [Deltaproteobacteria bacterium]|nr:AgmX/PglI C-terminal domain-containing protein [Deltaproteobacteria bacterium]
MKNVAAISYALSCMALACAAGCGGAPELPKVEDPTSQPQATSTRKTGPTPQVSQELGSIDPKKVEQTFAGLQKGALEACHKQGRERVDVMSGDVKVFLRIDQGGKVRYGYLEDSTLGDRETEKCILSELARATWPKPEGGEAEVRSGFGWGSGGEREPTAWSSDKVQQALLDAKDVKSGIGKCKAGIKGDFKVTAYVEHDDSAPAAPTAKPKGKKDGKDKGGKFKAIGVSAPSKEASEKIDCLVDALKPLELPSPGSYPAKVTFSL